MQPVTPSGQSRSLAASEAVAWVQGPRNIAAGGQCEGHDVEITAYDIPHTATDEALSMCQVIPILTLLFYLLVTT